jgi:acetolactate synthase-1/2/3 large subunit
MNLSFAKPTTLEPAHPPYLDAEPAVQTKRACDVVVDILANAGVEVIFGLPGGTIAPIYDALLDRPEIRVITTRHESGAMFAAAAYARTTGKLGVVLVTSGPGVLNALTGLASAQCDSIPLLLIGGEVARSVQGRGALQEGSAYNLNVVAMASHITKLSLEIPEATAVPAMMRRAMATAVSGRPGPVFVSLPMDVSCKHIAPPRFAHQVRTQCQIEPSALERAAYVLQNGGKQVIFAGSGLRASNGPTLLRELAEKLQCPVMTTPKAKGVFPEDHPLSLGVYGLGGHISAQEYVDGGLDVMLAIGTSLGDVQTNGWSDKLIPKHELIHVDVDPMRVGRTYAVTLGVAAPATAFLEGVLALCEPSLAHQSFGVRDFTSAEASVSQTPGRISPARALWEIQQIMPADTIYTIDAGEHFVFATHFLRITEPDSFFCMTGLGSMGPSIGGAIGCKLARPDRTVAAICGDGGFAMVGTEVATAVQAETPIVVFVFNDGRYGMVEQGNERVYGRTPLYPVSSASTPILAKELGAETLQINAPDQLLERRFNLRRPKKSWIVEILIDESFRFGANQRMANLAAIAAKANHHQTAMEPA